MEILERKQKIAPEDLSRLYVYYNTRELDKTIDRDEGAYLPTAMKAIQRHGACLESMWSYNKTNLFVKPTDECYKDGANRQAIEYARVQQGYGVRSALADGFPVVFGMMLAGSFYDVGKKDGMIPLPKRGDPMVGGHAMLIVGYDTIRHVYLVRNSWGVGWGDNGYCLIPFEMVDHPQLSWDFFVIRSMEEPEASHKIVRGLRRQ